MTSQTAPPAKRQRTESELPSLSAVRRHETLWFDDGNIVIAAEDMLFRLHRGIICHHSQVFRDMFSAPHTGESTDIIDDCPVVRLSDCGENLAGFFTLLYDGGKDPFFNPDAIATFRVVRAMFILATKYDVAHVRAEALRRLRLRCITTLAGFDESVARIKAGQKASPVTFERLDDIGLINLARSFDLAELLPWPYYRLIVGDPTTLAGRADYGFGQFEQLSPQDLRQCLRGIMKFTEMVPKKMDMLLKFQASDECFSANDTQCRTRLTSAFTQGGCRRHFLLPMIIVPYDYATADLGNMCPECKKKWIAQYNIFRESVWNMLGEIIGIQPWPIPAVQTGE